MMTALFDIALLVICGCSAVYCWSLSRRLRALQNLKKGLGQSVVSLTQSVSAVETNADRLYREARVAVEELKQTLGKVDGAQNQVDILLETMDRQARETWKDHRKKVGDIKEDLTGSAKNVVTLINDAKTLSGMMNNQLIAWSEREAKAVKALGDKEQSIAAVVTKALEARDAATETRMRALIEAERGRLEKAASGVSGDHLAGLKAEADRIAALKADVARDLAAAKRIFHAIRDTGATVAAERRGNAAPRPASAASPRDAASAASAPRRTTPASAPVPAAAASAKASSTVVPLRPKAASQGAPASSQRAEAPRRDAQAGGDLSPRDAEIAQSLARRLAAMRRHAEDTAETRSVSAGGVHS